MDRTQLLFELEDDALVHCDLTSSLSLHCADMAVVDAMHDTYCNEYEQQEAECAMAEVDGDSMLRQWDGDSDCSDVRSTLSDRLTYSTSLPATSNVPAPLLLTFSSLPSSLPTLSPTISSSTIVAQWLHFHTFPATATQRLVGYTCSDLFALTKEDAKELLGVVAGIRLYYRIQACKQRANHCSHTRQHSTTTTTNTAHDEYECKYAADNDCSDRSSLHSSTNSSPQLVPPATFASAFRQRAQSAGLHYMAAAGSGVRCGVVGCVSGVGEWRTGGGLIGGCVECGCALCSVHMCKSLWTSEVYCPRCYVGDGGWVSGMCVIA